MARSNRVPKLTHHKGSGQSVVRFDGKDHYCGPWDTKNNAPSASAQSRYHRLMAEWIAADRNARPATGTGCVTVAEICEGYLRHALGYYVKNGHLTPEYDHVRTTIKMVVQLYGELLADHFDPLALKACRQQMVERCLARTTINQHVSRIKRIFAWAGENGLADPLVYHRLHVVKGLRRGRGGREPRKRQPVSRDLVDAVRPYVSRQIWAMIELQWHSGMRPGSAVIMRTADLDTSGPIWYYRPTDHKTAYLDRELVIALGPQAQAVLKSWIRTRTEEYLFQPVEAIAEKNEVLRKERITPLWPSSINRPHARRPKKAPGEHYTVASYRRSITEACTVAAEKIWQEEHGADSQLSETFREFLRGQPSWNMQQDWLKEHGRQTRYDLKFIAFRKRMTWTPHRLRHSFATRAGEIFGHGQLDKIAAALGHANVDVTMLYAHINRKKAAEVARRIG